MLTKSQEANENYLAQIVQLGDPIKHVNADRLVGWSVNGNKVWTNGDYKKGDYVVYFPLESAINPLVLSKLNLYSNSDNNENKSVKGYFPNTGRVKAVRLRGEPSEGFILPLKQLMSIFGPIMSSNTNDTEVVGKEFDTWNNILVCWKYIPQTVGIGTPRRDRSQAKVTLRSKLIQGQFRFHTSTAKLKNNVHLMSPEDMVALTYKLHGTSFVVANILTKKKLSWKDKLAKWIGANIQNTTYDVIYSSRSIIKNQYEDQKNNHYYGHDLWADIKDYLQPYLTSGITIYGEAVGFTASGKAIQKDYDYRYIAPDTLHLDEHNQKEYREGVHYGIYIYRITHTNDLGEIIEFTWPQVTAFCDKHGLNHVPQLFFGKAKELVNINTEAHWHENVIQALSEVYLEKDCFMCTNRVPAEGVVLRIDKAFDPIQLKLKSFRFLEKESKDLDSGEIDTETEQS